MCYKTVNVFNPRRTEELKQCFYAPSGVARGGDGGVSPRAALLEGAAKLRLYLKIFKIWKGEKCLEL